MFVFRKSFGGIFFGNRTLTIAGIRSGYLALKSMTYHIQMIAVSVGEALMVAQLWEAGRRKRVVGALHSVS